MKKTRAVTIIMMMMITVAEVLMEMTGIMFLTIYICFDEDGVPGSLLRGCLVSRQSGTGHVNKRSSLSLPEFYALPLMLCYEVAEPLSRLISLWPC